MKLAREQLILYKKRIKTFRYRVLTIGLITLIIGGCVFSLSVKTRPILRITVQEDFLHVKWILDLMLLAGVSQLAISGLDVFVSCTKSMWAIYFGITMTAVSTCLEASALGTSLHLLHSAMDFANEDVVHLWYWVECQHLNSCHEAMMSYIYRYVLPQIVLVSFSLFFHGLAILYLGRMVRTMADHEKTMGTYREWYRNHYNDQLEDPDFEKVEMSDIGCKMSNSFEMVEEHENDQCGEKEIDGDCFNFVDDEIKTINSADYDPNYNTPCSILKTDHGYIPGSAVSTDYDKDVFSRQRVSHTQSITFNADVEVHYFNPKTRPTTKSPEAEKNLSFQE